MYLTAASTISHQPTFQNSGFSSGLSALTEYSEVLHPDYNVFIPANYRRRMSEVIKMAVACTLDCLAQTKLEQPDAIIVGTSMGCNHFTKNFLDKILNAGSGLISPTSFMLSTHNTIAGQISLLLGNHRYNMTHTQNSLSFEQALLDALLAEGEGKKNILIGGADESENDLYDMRTKLGIPQARLTCGASFFILSGEKPKSKTVQLMGVESIGLVDDLSEPIAAFLANYNLKAADIDLLLVAGQRAMHFWTSLWPGTDLCDYTNLAGTYLTNSAFALHYGMDFLLHSRSTGERWVLIANNLIPENLGLTLLTLDQEK